MRARQSYEFLQRLRNELHFGSNRKTDTLSHSVLTTVAKSFSVRKGRAQKDSEAFLHHYYLEVRRIERVLDALTSRLQQDAKATRPAWLASKLIRFAPGKTISRRPKGEVSLAGTTPEQWMRAFRYGQAGAVSLDAAAQSAIRENSTRFRQCFRHTFDWGRLSGDLAQ